MLVSTPRVRAPPARTSSVHDFFRDSGAPCGEATPAAAKSRSSITSSSSGGGGGSIDDVGQGGDRSKDPEDGSTKAPLLDKPGHRRKPSHYLGEEDSGEGSPRHRRRPKHAAEGDRSPLLCGPDGLLSPPRVRVLLLLQCLVSVRA